MGIIQLNLEILIKAMKIDAFARYLPLSFIQNALYTIFRLYLWYSVWLFPWKCSVMVITWKRWVLQCWGTAYTQDSSGAVVNDEPILLNTKSPQYSLGFYLENFSLYVQIYQLISIKDFSLSLIKKDEASANFGGVLLFFSFANSHTIRQYKNRRWFLRNRCKL